MSKLLQFFLAGMFILGCAAVAEVMAQTSSHPGRAGDDWPVYGHDAGGMNWSGCAYDPQHRLLVVNADNMPAKMGVVAAEKFREEAEKNRDAEYTAQSGGPYGMFRTFLFARAHHLPCAPPPWGTLTGVDMATGTTRWQVPLGSISRGDSAVPPGAPSLGGPIVTAGGLVFIAGTIIDPSFRAFDVETGKEIWQYQLPTSGGATPMT